jgi:hypothetical protein
MLTVRPRTFVATMQGPENEKTKKTHEEPFQVFSLFVSPPAIATTNAKKNHFPHHLERAVAVGGPVGRAGKLGSIFRAALNLEA